MSPEDQKITRERLLRAAALLGRGIEWASPEELDEAAKDALIACIDLDQAARAMRAPVEIVGQVEVIDGRKVWVERCVELDTRSRAWREADAQPSPAPPGPPPPTPARGRT